MERKVYNFASGRIDHFNYVVEEPKGLDKNEPRPMVVFLHGAGERGDDHELLFVHGPTKNIKAGREYPAIIIAPQCPSGEVWPHLTVELFEFIEYCVKEYGADPARISLTGISMGGFGTWDMGMSYPDYFSALAPICGGGHAFRASVLKGTPVWAFHGECDRVVSVSNSLEVCDALKRAGGEVELTILKYVDHNSWDFAYGRTNVVEWLISKTKKMS